MLPRRRRRCGGLPTRRTRKANLLGARPRSVAPLRHCWLVLLQRAAGGARASRMRQRSAAIRRTALDDHALQHAVRQYL
jgi:hypothetical protein